MDAVRRNLCLIPAILLLMTISGCEDEDGQEPGPSPEVLSVSLAGTWELPSASGWDVPSNASITVTFSKEMATESVVISLNSIPISATSQDSRTFTFTPGTEGEYELAITGEDTFGQTLDPPYSPISFTVTEADTIPPYIVDDEWHCDKDDLWCTVVLEFQEEHLNLDGGNILTISAMEDAMRVCNIVVTTVEVFWL